MNKEQAKSIADKYIARDGAASAIAADTIGATILDEVYSFVGRFVAFPSDHSRIAHTLWIAHTHFIDALYSSPRLSVQSAEYGSGKTRLLETTATLVPLPFMAVNASPSAIYREFSDDSRPTFLIDEVDAVFGNKASEQNESLRSIINTGYKRGFAVRRTSMAGQIAQSQHFATYCAVAMAGKGRLPQSLLERSVIIRMKKRAPNQKVESWRDRLHEPIGHAIAERLGDWAAQVMPSIRDNFPELPAGIEDRNAEVWEPLISIADAARGHWPQAARAAALEMIKTTPMESLSLTVHLLRDIHQIFGDRDRVTTEQLVDELQVFAAERWQDPKQPLTPYRLARMLADHDLHPMPRMFDGVQLRGYDRAWFEDAWRRHLPPDGPKSPSVASTPSEVPALADGPDVSDGLSALNAHTHG